MAVATQRAAVYADHVEFLGEDPGPGAGGDLYCFTRHFSNAQVKALPTTGLEVLPTPGSDYTWVVLSCLVMLDSSDAAYTNIDAAAYLQLDVYGTDYVANDADLGFADCTAFLGVAGHQLVPMRGRYASEINGSGALATYQATNWAVRAYPVAYFTDKANAPVLVQLNNAASGDLTGGHANNSLLVRTLAMRVPSPTLWATLYPT
jgi:hypothetical protein